MDFSVEDGKLKRSGVRKCPKKLMDTQKTWNKILDYIKQQVSATNFKTWFSQASVGEITDSQITLIVPSAFIQGQLIKRYEPLLHQAIEQVLNKDLQLIFSIDSSKSIKKTKKEFEPQEEEDFFTLSSTSTSSQPISPLNPKYTLKNFVVGLTNNLAFAAAQAVAQHPGTSYNPLFIYGQSGVGKTHLMQGIGNALLAKNPQTKIVYVSSERFMNDFVDSIRNKKTGDFRQKYRSCEILLIDDIQFISGKDSTQEEFFHTFNELHSKNAQLVFTSDRSPNDIQKLEPRLQSRFQGGLMVDIQLPDFDTRMAIIKAKLHEQGETLSEELIAQIAENTATNTRELEGKLIQILQMAKLNNQAPTPELVQRFLGKPIQAQSKTLDSKKLLQKINEFFNTKLSDLTGPRRQKELVLPRQIAMFLMYEECKIPMEKIGQILGGRDHTTVLHGIEKIKTSIQRDREVQRLIIELKQQLL